MPNEYIKFIKAIKKNNHKEWMDANRDWYHKIREQLVSDIEKIIASISKIDGRFQKLTAKDCMFRINRDIRFSSDKRPYKENLAIYLSILGKKSSGPGYYLHIEPGNSFFACGCWMPPSDVLNKIREEIDYNSSDFLKIINDKNFKKQFGEIEGDKVKTTPKGYDKNHPMIEFLKLKSYIVSVAISDKEISDESFKKLFISFIKTARPFHDFLLTAVHDEEL
ncbi:MAG: TIGR02453 family protein [Bacteroidia bacterium]|nr:MAG: TIGR02453 family protein [Bacteroidia bacterium]